MGAYDNVDAPGAEIRQRLLDLLRCPEAAEQRHIHGEALHALHKSVVNLLGQNRGRHKVCHLL